MLRNTLFVLAAMTGPASADTCERTGDKKTCYSDDGKRRKTSTSTYREDIEVGPRTKYRDDGSVERVEHVKPDVGAYRSVLTYYETGDLRRAELTSPDSQVGIEYFVSRRIRRVWCLPGKDGGYGYSIAECQPKVAFKIATWRPR